MNFECHHVIKAIILRKGQEEEFEGDIPNKNKN